MKILVINGATRPGNVTQRVARWAATAAKTHPDFEVELVELADFNLPFLHEAGSPRYNPQRQVEPEVQAWLDKVAWADGYIIASPEYNRTLPGALKNAIDLLGHEIDHKPVALATHGSTGGALAAESIRTALRGMSVANIAEAATVMGASELIDEDGNLAEAAKANPYGPQFAIDSLVASLAWWTKTLKAGRDAA